MNDKCQTASVECGHEIKHISTQLSDHTETLQNISNRIGQILSRATGLNPNNKIDRDAKIKDSGIVNNLRHSLQENSEITTDILQKLSELENIY